MTPHISDDLARFLESGVAITVATRDGDLQPDGAWGWAVRVHDDREHVTLYLHENGASAMLRNLHEHPEIAIVLDHPSTHRACQVKGFYESSRKARKDESGFVKRQVEGFAADLEAIGIPREMTAAWNPWPCMAISLKVASLFEQTPGPGAGEPMR